MSPAAKLAAFALFLAAVFGAAAAAGESFGPDGPDAGDSPASSTTTRDGDGDGVGGHQDDHNDDGDSP